MENKPSLKGTLIGYGAIAVVLSIMAFEIAALILWVPSTWNYKVMAVFVVIGTYGLATALFSKSKVLKDYRFILEHLTSPNIREYMAGNAHFLVYPPLLIVIGLSKYAKSGYSPVLWIIGGISLLILSPIVFAYILFHLLVVVPMTYIPMVLVSAIVHRIEYSAEDPAEKMEEELKIEKLIISSIVKDDPIAAKGFLIGIPSLILSVYSALSGLFIN